MDAGEKTKGFLILIPKYVIQTSNKHYDIGLLAEYLALLWKSRLTVNIIKAMLP